MLGAAVPWKSLPVGVSPALLTPQAGIDANPAAHWGRGALWQAAAAAVVLTPAHQFPTGVPLSPARRAQVLEWARATGGVVIEDDYDGEFRYDQARIGAIQPATPTT